MADHDSELIGLEFVADVLQPIQLVVWGDLAIRYLGVPVVHDCYMLGVHDKEMDLAVQKLTNRGFVRQSWSFSSAIDPATRKDDKMYKRIHEEIRPAYADFDAKTVRLYYLEKQKHVQQTVLIPSSYIHLRASQAPSYASEHWFGTPNTSVQPPYYIHGNLYYPNVVMLLESIIMVCIQERARTKTGTWQAKLETWAIGYLYGELSLRDDVLDTCQNSEVKGFWDMEIEREFSKSRAREKLGRLKPLITNALIKDYQ